MKTSEIQPGKEYYVRLSELDAMVWRGATVKARVIRAGFHYDVEVVTASRVRGAPYKRSHQSEHPSGVEIQWDTQQVESARRHMDTETCHGGRAIVNSRAIKDEV